MPKLGAYKTKKIFLPSTKKSSDKAWVLINLDIPIGWIKEVEDITVDSEKTIHLLTRVIKDWNFTDSSDAKAEINKENISQLSMEDLLAITSELNLEDLQKGLNKEQKKS